ncbi:hypothetical protein [Phytoactinopolyspora alkaliphila]|uniref:hypothetical protein n=1 Tax=Phytoactinopolyspora alkaliphila TaxID=1783498 RepID=UPI001C20881F|nr:hypothetical protein [Phytoactinopolyspora alkaliphila]
MEDRGKGAAGDRPGGGRSRRSRARRRAVIVGTGVAVSAAGATVARARYRDWGSTPDERDCRLPGDELIADPASFTTRAVTIKAPPAEVWKWLVQIGQDRGGWYSYEWLENLFGLNIHNARELRPEWQQLAPGDRVWAVPAGSKGRGDGYAFLVAQVQPGQALVLSQSPPEHPWDATWAFALADDGRGGCRLLARGRVARRPGFTGTLAWVGGELLDPVTMVMTRKMLLGIRARAEFAHDVRRRRSAGAAPDDATPAGSTPDDAAA